MGLRLALVGLAVALAAAAGKPKEPGVGTTGNDVVELYATIYPYPDQIKPVLGSDLGGHYIVVKVQLTPKYEKELTVSHDDFELRTDKDGEKAAPWEPSQIAGRGELVINQNTQTQGMAEPTFGGPMAPPVMVGPRIGGGVGNNSAESGHAPVQQSGVKEKANPMKQVLQEKMLAEGKTTKPVAGLLYFPLEKQKMKDLELIYNTPEGKLRVRFREEK